MSKIIAVAFGGYKQLIVSDDWDGSQAFRVAYFARDFSLPGAGQKQWHRTAGLCLDKRGYPGWMTEEEALAWADGKDFSFDTEAAGHADVEVKINTMYDVGEAIMLDSDKNKTGDSPVFLSPAEARALAKKLFKAAEVYEAYQTYHNLQKDFDDA